MNKHTPGPWTRFANSIKSRKADCVVVRLPALTDCFGDETPEQIARWDADAYLIAAAPELLEALEQVLGIIAMSDRDGGCTITHEMQASWEKLLAKSKGEV